MSIHNELGLDYRQELELVHDRLDALLVHDAGFEHLLHGELSQLLSLEPIAGDAPHFAKATAPYSVLVLKERLVQICRLLVDSALTRNGVAFLFALEIAVAHLTVSGCLYCSL